MACQLPAFNPGCCSSAKFASALPSFSFRRRKDMFDLTYLIPFSINSSVNPGRLSALWRRFTLESKIKSSGDASLTLILKTYDKTSSWANFLQFLQGWFKFGDVVASACRWIPLVGFCWCQGEAKWEFLCGQSRTVHGVQNLHFLRSELASDSA